MKRLNAAPTCVASIGKVMVTSILFSLACFQAYELPQQPIMDSSLARQCDFQNVSGAF